MPATVLTSQHYDAVRGLIAPDVTAEHIPDDYLSQQPFAPDAEREVRKRLDAEGIDVDTLTGDDRDDALLSNDASVCRGVVFDGTAGPTANAN